MKLQTEITIPKSKASIDYHSKLLLMGSCFSDTIGEKLKTHMFEADSNPFGISYNPQSIVKLITDSIEGSVLRQEEFISHGDLYKHYDLHSVWSSTDLRALTESVNRQFEKTRQNLESASHLIITLGTAYVYELKSNGMLVNNCHKQPAELFQKRLLSVDDITQSLSELIQKLKLFNPKLNIVFTLSPVRHLKDGFVENNRSKAHLRTALFEVLDQHQSEYFPSNELLLDELRDYRYFDRDLIHPNDLAIDYIWEKFTETYMDEETLSDMKLAHSIYKAKTHKAFYPESEAHRSFLKKTEEKQRNFYTKYPHLNVSK